MLNVINQLDVSSDRGSGSGVTQRPHIT